MKQLEVSIEDKVKQVILREAKRELNPADLALDTPLLGKELGLDSVGLFELVVSLEKELDILLDESDLTIEVFANIGTLADHVKKKCCRQ